MHQPGDAGGDRVVFDAGELAGIAQRGGQQREEQAGAHAGFQHPPAGEAEPFGGAPEAADDRLRRVVGILRSALQGGVFFRRDGGFERRAGFLPAGAKFASSPGRRKQFCARSEAPKPIKRSNRACSSAVAARPDSSNSFDSLMAAMLSRARAGHPRARARSESR